jgi:hypothetical protein
VAESLKTPDIASSLAILLDHEQSENSLDVYSTFILLKKSFKSFASRTPGFH